MQHQKINTDFGTQNKGPALRKLKMWTWLWHQAVSERWKGFEARASEKLKMFEEPVKTCLMEFEEALGKGLKECEESVVGNWR